MMTRRRFSGLAFAAGMTAALVAGPMANGSAVAADKIILGDMNSYTGFASFTIPYRQGWELALEEINAILSALGIPEELAVFDPSVVRGLGYYTGPVFETELLATPTYADGSPMQFGSVASGGRYDDLVARFTGQQVPATGFSFGVSRFAAALSALGRLEGADAAPLVIVVAADKAHMADYFAMAAELRAAGLRAEAFTGNGNMGKQLKYADRRDAAFAVICGEEEFASGTAQIKDLKLGAELAESITDRDEWKEQKQQFSVPRSELVSAILTRLSARG